MSNDDRDGPRKRPSQNIANHERLVSLGHAVDQRAAGKSPRGGAKRRKSRSRRFIWIRRSLIAITALIVLVVGAVVADYYYLGSLIHHKNVSHLQTSGTTENILLIGSTTRCGLKVQNKAYGLCSQGVTGVNSDITMVIHLDPSTGSVSLLSIPRDLFVPNARLEGANKIDAALYEGPSQLVAAVEEDFAIPINHYVELNFDTFANVVDALGGVRMYFPVPIYDQDSGLNIERSGCYLLNGYHALQVVRARHLQIQPNPSNHEPHTWPQEALSDLARIRRTHEFLRVIAAEVAARGLGDPITDQHIATAVLPYLTVDNGFSESHMLSLAKTFAHAHIANIPQLTYPVINVETGSYLYQGYYYGDVVFPVQPTGVDVVNQIFGVKPGINSFTNQALPSPHSFKVAIENASGVAGQAALVDHQLTAKGFRISSIGNATPVGKVGETVVWYGGPRPPAHGNWNSPSLAAAQSIIEQLQGPAMLGYNPAKVVPGSSVTIQTGTDLTVKTASTGTTKTTAKSHSTTTTKSKSKTTTSSTLVTSSTVYDPPGVRTNNLFSAPSSTNQGLQPWDPRACNAAGTGPAVTSKP